MLVESSRLSLETLLRSARDDGVRDEYIAVDGDDDVVDASASGDDECRLLLDEFE